MTVSAFRALRDRHDVEEVRAEVVADHAGAVVGLVLIPALILGLLGNLRLQVIVAFLFPGSRCASVLDFSGFSGAPFSLAKYFSPTKPPTPK